MTTGSWLILPVIFGPWLQILDAFEHAVRRAAAVSGIVQHRMLVQLDIQLSAW